MPRRERNTSLDCLRVYLSWNFALIRYCVLTWVMKILMRDILNVHAGQRSPPPPLTQTVVLAEIPLDEMKAFAWRRRSIFLNDCCLIHT